MTDLENIRSRVQALGMGFKFIKPIQTDRNGIRRETWLLEYQGSQFVFVEGRKNVTLGWDVEQCPLGDGVLEGLKKDFSEGHEHFYGQAEEIESYYGERIAKAEEDGDSGKAEALRAELEEELDCIGDNEDYENWEGYFAKWNQHLSQCVSPLRAADIGDMIVEADHCFLEEDAPSLEDAVQALKKGPFTLATEDEWEYLYNGGARTLFRWGDHLSDVLSEIFRVGTAMGDEAGEDSVLNRPNPLGLFIGYDSYQCEIIDNASFTKGGDGGGSLCGGDGAIYVLPCYTAFYRHPADQRHPALSRNYYCYRRIIRLP